jgi:DNA-directed RNA polymerase specialized sigma24 family protein
MKAVEPSDVAAQSDRRLPAGVAALFGELEPRLREALFAYGDPAEIDDAIGETFVVLCDKAVEVLAMDNPRGYLYRVARDKVRGPRRLRPVLPPVRPELQPDVTPELLPALAKLTRPQRTAVFLGAGMGWTWEEIAEFLGTSQSTARNHYRRGITKLRHDLGEVEP